jgi:hypothetical protein
VKESLILIKQTIALINYYSFDLGQYTAKELIIKWSKKYPHFWLPLAVLEAIYQGRLKGVSVEQILNRWDRMGIPNYQFNAEFEELVSHNIDDDFTEIINLEETLDSQVEISMNNQELQENYYRIVSDKSPIKIFQPVKDYSHCYSQLKSLSKF